MQQTAFSQQRNQMGCRNICEKHRATKHRRGSYYDEGCKRCTVCTLFIRWEGTECPCCGSTLRTKPRNFRKGQH